LSIATKKFKKVVGFVDSILLNRKKRFHIIFMAMSLGNVQISYDVSRGFDQIVITFIVVEKA